MIIKNKGFTLVELLTTIIITGILLLGISNISITKISESQKVEIFRNKVIANIETVINNSLIGKAIGIVGTDLIVPDLWKIEINNNSNGNGFGTGNIIVNYIIGGGTITHTGLTIKPNKFYGINNIRCNNLANTNETLESNIDLQIKNGNITLSGCTNNDQKIIKFNVFYKDYKKEIYINSVNNVISSN